MVAELAFAGIPAGHAQQQTAWPHDSGVGDAGLIYPDLTGPEIFIILAIVVALFALVPSKKK
ncbi:hypothetical protein CWB41_14110 [Methylovirgula ligni]|uniref:Uncharacterized protein n=1 Tax=Methylovirgula ligni TaxID=569860 RepID=A0A3D9YMV8_9HYPH|nr:hypothetical protein [Methylovirgula ligni]QAY96726.1 hypothetical protein CWB41_14110 [Methylovirgula ligni]REF83231.1 hypothetical protein DES32_3147 [Methylovirgula ligni]